jgi:hypothetical protein
VDQIATHFKNSIVERALGYCCPIIPPHRIENGSPAPLTTWTIPPSTRFVVLKRPGPLIAMVVTGQQEIDFIFLEKRH